MDEPLALVLDYDDFQGKRDMKLFDGSDMDRCGFFGADAECYLDRLITFDENYKNDPYDKKAGFDKKFEPNFNLYGIKPGKYQLIRFCAWKVPFVAVSDDGKKQDATLYLLAWGTFKPTADYPDRWEIFSSYSFVAFPRVE